MRYTYRISCTMVLCWLSLWAGLQAPAAAQMPPLQSSIQATPALQSTQAAQALAMLVDLEQQAQGAAPAIALSQADLALATQRERAAQANQGARVFGGVSLANAREAVTDTLSRNYQRAQVQAGLRWPLWGSREAQLRAVSAAGVNTSLAQVRWRQTQRDAVLAVRRAYVRHLRSAQQAALGQSFLRALPTVDQQMQQRQTSGLLLKAERLEWMTRFDEVKATQSRQLAQQTTALRELSRLTGQPVLRLPAQSVEWPTACHSAEALMAQGEDHSPVLLARMELDGVAQAARHVRREGLEAGVSVAQSFSRDVGGSPGRNTTVAVDFSVPLQWRALRDVSAAQVQSEHQRAESLLLLRRSEFQSALEQALIQQQLRDSEMALQLRRLQAAHEALRVAALRLETFDGDGFAKLLSARHALYQSTVQVIDSAERRELAQIDLQALGTVDCGQPSVPQDDPASHAMAVSVAALASWPPVGTAIESSLSPSPDQGHLGLTWYQWNGQSLLDQPRLLQTLPAGSRSVLLSFSAAQLHQLASAAGNQKLRHLVTLAHRKALRIELLLGEPTWVLPAHRQALLDLLGPLRLLPWDGLHLDLERSQLSLADQPHWERHAIDTLRAVRAVVPWPVALTTHYRELQDPGFAHRVHAAGVTTLVPMVYVSNPLRAAEIVAPLLRGPDGLQLAVAQSVESDLPPEESSHALGQTRSLDGWRVLAEALKNNPAFKGVMVQSLEEFTKARP